MAKKTISNTFTVNTVEDGESAPYYFQEWFAWSNDASTSSVTTPPTISGSWETSIPAQGSYAYLWRKSIRYVWNENMRRYSEETAQYFRMSGTNGTSINTKGTIKVAITASGTFPTAGFSSGDLGIKQGDSYMWQFNGSSWSHVSSASSDGDSYTMTKDCTIDLEGDGTSENIKGHLIQWSTEASKWIDLGQFKGENGKTFYTHVAWATKVNYNSSGEVTSVEGFIPDKSPNDTTHLWMGVLVNESSGADPSDATYYTWSYTKGVDGNDAVTYDIVFSEAWARVDNSNTVSAALKGYAYKVEGNTRTVLYGEKIRLGYILNDSDTYVDMPTSYGYFDDGGWFNGDNIIDYGKNSANIFAAIIINNAVVCVKYVTIAKQGQTGGRGKVGRFFYYAGAFNVGDSTTRFLVNDAQSPYFSYNNQYWVYNPETNPSGGYATMAQMGNPSASSSKWKIMTNDFKYIITEAIFGAYAHFGSFIINGDWMISQHGVIYDTNGGIHTIDANHSYGDYNVNNAYTLFDVDYPNSSKPNANNFVPNFAVDGLTGKTYQNDAYIRGEVHATSGTFNGIVKAVLMYSPTAIAASGTWSIQPSFNNPACYFCQPNLGGSTIILPSPVTYDGLEISFLTPFGTRQTGSTWVRVDVNASYTIHFSPYDAVTINGNTYYLPRQDGTLLLSHNRIYLPYNQLIKIKAINGEWYVVEGRVEASDDPDA